ncbi:MAG: heme-copper oxidase subunit III [Bacillati bacterium ANGP1]|uniref:Heme-copper oxidase subunit III n=1 Tax=Candidatus Segetimicrobium genomatis TaxID=2569760 RepID=A0A537LFF3_9BACT|nr:MAG: heme-copper oxidase subunit III [Terrabacteria group bacterium ANGP1]
MTTVASPPNVPPSVAPPRPVATRGPEPKPAETGVWVAIATISMSFAALTSAMVVRASAAPDWQHFRLPPILYLNTLVLLASSFTLAAARRRITAVSVRDGLPGLYVTLGLGLLFVTGQILAWRQLAAQGLFLATSPSSAFFYVFTALHGLHVLGGLAGLLYVLRRIRRVVPAPMTALGAATLYWHFMDVLWLYLLLILIIRV